MNIFGRWAKIAIWELHYSRKESGVVCLMTLTSTREH